jgi:hypothetical protein
LADDPGSATGDVWRLAEQGGYMAQNKVAEITVDSALRLVEVIREEARLAESEDVKRALLQTGIRIADLVIVREQQGRKRSKAAA